MNETPRFKVELVDWSNLTAEEGERQPNNGNGKEWANYLRVTYDGKTVNIYSDAIEPEDKTFSRDLKWIAGALIAAYGLGKQESSLRARAQGRAEGWAEDAKWHGMCWKRYDSGSRERYIHRMSQEHSRARAIEAEKEAQAHG